MLIVVGEFNKEKRTCTSREGRTVDDLINNRVVPVFGEANV